MLQELYRRRESHGAAEHLTHAAYEALGGLTGAIAAEAERAVSDLSVKPAQPIESLPAAAVVDEMAIDTQERAAVTELADHMLIPDLVDDGLRGQEALPMAELV